MHGFLSLIPAVLLSTRDSTTLQRYAAAFNRVTRARDSKDIHCISALVLDLLTGVFINMLSKARDIKAERVKAYKHTTSRIGKELFSLEKEGKKQKKKETKHNAQRTGCNQWLLVFSLMTSLASSLDFCSQALIQARDSWDSIKLVVITALPEATRPSPPHFLYSVP